MTAPFIPPRPRTLEEALRAAFMPPVAADATATPPVRPDFSQVPMATMRATSAPMPRAPRASGNPAADRLNANVDRGMARLGQMAAPSADTPEGWLREMFSPVAAGRGTREMANATMAQARRAGRTHNVGDAAMAAGLGGLTLASAIPAGPADDAARAASRVTTQAHRQITPEAIEAYAAAIAKRDKREARRILNESLGVKPKDWGTLDYQGAHSPAGPGSGAPAFDLTEVYPDDVYSVDGLRYYGTGDDAIDRAAYNSIMAVQQKPDAPLTIYRAVPKDSPQKTINPGDWVTNVRAYARGHGESALNGEYRILSRKVTAKDIYTSGDSWAEWGYHPQERMPRAIEYTGPANARRPLTLEEAVSRYINRQAPEQSPSPEASAIRNALVPQAPDASMIDVDGVMRPRLNSRGLPIHPDEEGIRNFWRWATEDGRAPIADEAGRPRMMFHGTAANYDTYNPARNRTLLNDQFQGDGFNLTPSSAVASKYADANRNRLLRRDEIFPAMEQKLPPAVAALFKDIVERGYDTAWDLPDEQVRHLLRVADEAGVDLNDIGDLAKKVEGTAFHRGREVDVSDTFSALFGGGGGDLLQDYDFDTMRRLGVQSAAPSPSVMPLYSRARNVLQTSDRGAARLARSSGYDAVSYNGDGVVDGVPEVVAFDPNQVKSAIGNSGAFSRTDPRITAAILAAFGLGNASRSQERP